MREVQQGMQGLGLVVRTVSREAVLFAFGIVQGMGVIATGVVRQRVQLARGRQHRLQSQAQGEQQERDSSHLVQYAVAEGTSHRRAPYLSGPRLHSFETPAGTPACYPGATPAAQCLRNEKAPHWLEPLQGLGLTLVAGDGIEPPTRGFSIPCSTN